MQAELSVSRAETATAKADAAAAIQEASSAGKKEIEYLTERTAQVS